MMSSTTRSTGCSPKRCERLLAVDRLDDAVAVALEREAEHLPDGLVVVDEQDRGGVVHLGFSGLERPPGAPACVLAVPASYYSPRMAAPTPSGRRRRRPRRGSLARPVNGRLYRASLLIVAAAAAAARVHDHAAGAAREARAAGLVRHRRRRSRSRTTSPTQYPDRAPGKRRRDRRGGLVRRPAAAAALRPQADARPRGSQRRRRARARAAPEHRGGRAGPVARRDRRHGAPRRHRRPGRARTTTRAARPR